MNFYLGCAVWAYKGWLGEFYPPKSQAKDFLSLYSRRFTTVEGNTTFYAVPSPDTVTRWRQETPEGFKFVPKLPRAITHHGLLNPYLTDALAFIERMRVLDARLGPIFAQLPPSYGPEYIGDLTSFLIALSEYDVSLSLEVRHPDWFEKPYRNQLNKLLRELNIGRVILDTRSIYNCPDDPQLYSERKKPPVPLQDDVTAGFTIVRFISHPDRQYNRVHLQEWVKKVKKFLADGIDVYFFVHCPVEEHSPFTAAYFQELLESAPVKVPPLPWKALQVRPEQLSLF